ncbi:unnamed protein product [Adineta ricciae]|uniref:Uncharacterized protein n=1 Tax=Adineta ricciae TaxID=249248 RepID=A0A813TF66_ADIRI|nr:unnamed protein product [Adineta ricciae]CAF1016957.1 unnamed protein product [Adineta ricciae]
MNEGLLDIIQSWLLNSPSHGIRRIGRARTLSTRLFWLVTFCTLTILMGIFISSIITKFVTYPTKIHLSIKHDLLPSDYPSVTFCNVNVLEDEIFRIDTRQSPTPNDEIINGTMYQKLVSNYLNRILTQQVDTQSKIFVPQTSHINESLTQCIFNQHLCYRNLTQLFHPTYGNCYTFDNVHHVQPEATTDLPHYWLLDDFNGDNDYRLFLELFLHPTDDPNESDTRGGYRVFIHRKYELPILSQNSVLLRPNKYTKLSFSQRTMSFSQECRNDLTEHMKNIFQTHKVRYSQALCYKLCEQQYIEQQCQCIEPTLVVFYHFFNRINETSPILTNKRMCSLENTCFRLQIDFDSRKLCPECLPECEIIQYSIQSSHADYPNRNSYEKVFHRLEQHFRLTQNQQQSQRLNISHPSMLRDHIVAVEISASPYPTEILTESPVYTWIDVISSIGGQTGLWIGISLIGFIEILELLYVVINRFYTRIFSRKGK